MISHNKYIPYIWALTTEGTFSVKSSYHSLNPPTPSPLFTWVWKRKLPPKLLHFIWVCCHDQLPTNNYLACLSIINSNICPICHTAPETSQHSFFQCHKASQLWSHLNISTTIQISQSNTTIKPIGCTTSSNYHLIHALQISHQKLSSPFCL